MNTMQEDAIQSVLSALTMLIMQQLCGATSRQYFPTHDADDDGTRIADGKRRAAELRVMRETFENLASGIINS